MKNIVLDLDETLIHTFSYREIDKDIIDYLLLQSTIIPFYSFTDNLVHYVMKRPYFQEFINYCLQHFNNVVIWSAGLSDYVETVLSLCCHNIGEIKIVLHRENCLQIDNNLFFNNQSFPDPGFRKDPGSKDLGSKDLGSKDPGSKDLGSKDLGSKDPGSKDPGSKDPGSKDPGSKDPGSKDLESKNLPSNGRGSKDLESGKNPLLSKMDHLTLLDNTPPQRRTIKNLSYLYQLNNEMNPLNTLIIEDNIFSIDDSDINNNIIVPPFDPSIIDVSNDHVLEDLVQWFKTQEFQQCKDIRKIPHPSFNLI